MSAPGGVELDRDGAVGICRISSPATRNALSPALLEAVARGLGTLDGDAGLGAIVLAGSDEVFATGADPAALGIAEGDGEAAGPWSEIAAVEKPIVAAVSGWALGAGFELALACDMLVVAKKARLGLPEVALGMVPGGGATQRLTHAIGKQRAMELVLTGRRMSAEQAHEFGLVNQLANPRAWLAEAVELARQVAERAPIAVRLAKRAVLAAERENLDEGLATERRLHDEAMATEDRVEGVRAFLEGRPPRFSGR